MRGLIVLQQIVMCPPVDYIDGPHYTLFIYYAKMVTQDQLKLSSIFRVSVLGRRIFGPIHPSQEDEAPMFIVTSLNQLSNPRATFLTENLCKQW